MKIRFLKLYLILITITSLHSTNAAEETLELKDKEIHFSQATKQGEEGLKTIVKLAAHDNKKSDVKKAIKKANEIQAGPEFSKYSHVDLAEFYSHLGWLHAKDNNLNEAIRYFTLVLDNRSPYDQSTYLFSINQLLVTSVDANRIDEVYNNLSTKHFPNLSTPQILTVAELYSQSLRFDLAEKAFALADEATKKENDYYRYLYFAAYIKNATLHKRQDILNKIATQYANENKTIKWSQLVAWKNKIAEDRVVPTKIIPPGYPEKALSRKISGYVVTEFTVDKNGKTKDIKIIEEYPKEYFKKVGIKATEKFIFKPLIGPDGVPVEIPNVRYRFKFSIRS